MQCCYCGNGFQVPPLAPAKNKKIQTILAAAFACVSVVGVAIYFVNSGANQSAQLSVLKVAGIIAGILLWGYLYFLPGTIASKKKKRNTTAIWMLNIFLGWTVLGWVGALVWACTED